MKVLGRSLLTSTSIYNYYIGTRNVQMNMAPCCEIARHNARSIEALAANQNMFSKYRACLGQALCLKLRHENCWAGKVSDRFRPHTWAQCARGLKHGWPKCADPAQHFRMPSNCTSANLKPPRKPVLASGRPLRLQ